MLSQIMPVVTGTRYLYQMLTGNRLDNSKNAFSYSRYYAFSSHRIYKCTVFQNKKAVMSIERSLSHKITTLWF